MGEDSEVLGTRVGIPSLRTERGQFTPMIDFPLHYENEETPYSRLQAICAEVNRRRELNKQQQINKQNKNEKT